LHECGARGGVGLNGAMALLSDADLASALSSLSGWERVGDEIVKTYERPAFADAIAFVVRIGFLAEAADHHPDLDIRWRKVKVALTTHDAGGLTDLDVELARRIEDAS
jgi:4a-hydroxytetrahydrobiopterin dehydratase